MAEEVRSIKGLDEACRGGLAGSSKEGGRNGGALSSSTKNRLIEQHKLLVAAQLVTYCVYLVMASL
jgi:hypothetical protein